jgi:hypothetical protein
VAAAQQNKLGKISIVVFLTALIWVWSDLAQDERLDLTNVVIEVARSGNPNVWVSFVVEDEPSELRSSVVLDTVVLKGPASRVAEFERLRNRGALDLDLFLVPDRAGLTTEGTQTFNVLEFLKGSDEIRQFGLTVENCEPRVLTVRTRELIRAEVPVECVGLPPSLEVVAIEPPTIDAHVPRGQTYRATVQLTADEQNQARNAPVEKTPYIELAGQRWELSTKVSVRLAAAQNLLNDYQVAATLGFCFSPILQGKYRVKLVNELELASVLIKATPFAHQAYASESFQLILYIEDVDRQASGEIRRPIVFTFPEEYVRRDEIRADQRTPIARFTLEPIPEAMESDL